MRRILCLVGLVFVATASGWAQRQVEAPRGDGKVTPFLVFERKGAGGGCAPLAIFSHGAGGSERGYRYMADALSGMGYTTIMLDHRESGMRPLLKDMRAEGRKGIEELVVDPVAEQDRLLDVGAALAWADKQCKAPFKVLLGHSMGSITTMLEAGAKNQIGVAAPPAGQDRFDAYVAMSPEGPGVVFADGAWKKIRKPMYTLSGSLDRGLSGGPETRLVPWEEMPGTSNGCHWSGYLEGATHMSFGGRGVNQEKLDPVITGSIGDFLSGVRAGHCGLPAVRPGLALKTK